MPETIIQMGRRDAERLVLAGNAAPTEVCAATGMEAGADLANAGKRVVRLVAGDAARDRCHRYRDRHCAPGRAHSRRMVPGIAGGEARLHPKLQRVA